MKNNKRDQEKLCEWAIKEVAQMDEMNRNHPCSACGKLDCRNKGSD